MALSEAAMTNAKAIVLLFAALLIHCSPRPADVRLHRIGLQTPPQLDPQRDALRSAFQTHLDNHARRLSWGDRKDASHRLRSIFQPPRLGDASQGTLLLELSPIDETLPFAAQIELKSWETNDLVLAFTEAWQSIEAQRTIAVGRDKDVIAALSKGSLPERLFATRLLGNRKAAAATPALIELLRDDGTPEPLALAAIGALVSIGDEAAVSPLIDISRQKPPAFVLQIVFAVGSIGGRTAEGFLVTLAGGHPHPAIQQGAQDALSELKSKQR